MSKTEYPKDRTLSIEKLLKAPIELVWEAWTQADHISKWWGHRGMPVEVVQNDLRPGGAWRFEMKMPDGNTFVSEGVYSLVEPPRRIVTSANFRPMTEGVEMHMLFEAQGEDTLFTFHVIHPTAEYCRQQEQMGFYNGWGSVFNNLAALLEGAQA